jgi:hypothetical protein
VGSDATAGAASSNHANHGAKPETDTAQRGGIRQAENSSDIPSIVAPVDASCHADDTSGGSVVSRTSSIRRTQARSGFASKCECLDLVNAAACVSSHDKTCSAPDPLSKLKLFDANVCTKPTRFFMNNNEIVCGLLQQLRSECPALMASRASFMQTLGEIYDEMTQQRVK